MSQLIAFAATVVVAALGAVAEDLKLVAPHLFKELDRLVREHAQDVRRGLS